MERSDDTYVNFKLTAVLCRLLGQFPVISMKSLNTIEFKLISIVSVASLSIYTYSIYFIIQLIEKGWLYYVYNFFYIQLILFYYINYFKHKKIITFLKEIKLFDDEACALLNIRALYHNPLKKYYWLGCSILSLSSQILLIFFLTTINLSTLRRTDFLHMFCRLSLYLPGINYIFMLNELEVRLCMLRHSLIDSLSKMEKYPINIMNHLIIEKYRFLHARAIHCLTAFMDAYSVFLPAEFYISGLAIIINILGILSGFDTEELIRSVISAIYDTVCIFYIIHQSWKIGREGLEFIEEIYQIKVNNFDSQMKHQIDIFIKQIKMRPFIITTFGIDISSWSVYSVYTTLIATYIIAISQLSSQIIGFLT